MSEDIAEIAAKLTKAQLDIIMGWAGSHDEVTDPALDPFWYCITKYEPGRFRLSPTNLGLAVRAHLLARENGGAK